MSPAGSRRGDILVPLCPPLVPLLRFKTRQECRGSLADGMIFEEGYAKRFSHFRDFPWTSADGFRRSLEYNR